MADKHTYQHHARELSADDESRGFLAGKWPTSWKKRGSGKGEHASAVISRSRWTSVLPITIHLFPLAATVAVATLNIGGYFIGAEMAGISGHDSLDFLLLQITAKLFEVSVVASLALIILDTTRSEILFADEGLPFGLLTAKFNFSDFRYLFSKSLWQGICSLSSVRKKVCFVWLFVTCTLVALFSGPSIALLLLPVMRNDWPAGSANFWLLGSNNSLWPAELTQDSIGVTLYPNATCKNPQPEALNMESLTYAGCIWAGYPALTETFKGWHGYVDTNVTIQDGRIKRQLLAFSGAWWDKTSDTWATTTNAAVGLTTQYITDGWFVSILTQTVQSIRSAARFKFRAYSDGTQTVVKTELPVVRVACNSYSSVNPAKIDGTAVLFPFLPPFEERNPSLSPNLDYGLGVKWQNSSKVATNWFHSPSSINIITNHSTITYFPSAFLSVQLPTPNKNVTHLLTCSIDAKWAKGSNRGFFSFATRARYDAKPETLSSLYPQLESQVVPWSFWKYQAQDDGAWRPVNLSVDWLNQLTPSLNSSIPGWTTLSNIITSLDMDLTGSALQPLTESIVATMVTDGMSRVGYGQALKHAIANNDILNDANVARCAGQADCFGYMNTSQIHNMITQKGTVFDPPANLDSSEITPLNWNVTITGFSYRVDGIAYILALIVLFTHSALSLFHIIALNLRRTWSSAWSSVEDLLILCYLSKPNDEDVPVNAVTGIKSKYTYRIPARLRAQDPADDVTDASIQLRLRKSITATENASKVQAGKKY